MRARHSACVLGLALITAIGCGDGLAGPAADATLLGGGGPAPATDVPASTELRRPRIDLSQVPDGRTIVQLPLATPGVADDVGTGSALLITIPGAGTFGCTANFVWESAGRWYLGAAGHCFLPEDRVATHGAGSDYDATGVTVDVCVEGCDGNFNLNELIGTWARLGSVAYARQSDGEGNGVGNDFGVVEIPEAVRPLVRIIMPVWGGPAGVATLGVGGLGCHYGHGLLVGELFPTKARVGVGGGSAPAYWRGDFAAAFGDSGSGMVACAIGLTGLRGGGAVGVLTHLGVEVDPATGGNGVVFGTTVARAVEMGQEAGLLLRLVTL
jgi:hypothetical protein